MKNELVIVDAGFDDIEAETTGASEHGITVRRSTAAASSDIPGALDGATGLLVQYLTVDAAVMDTCPNLKVIGRYGVGVDNVDLEAATSRGISVVNVPDYCVEEVATHAVAMALSAWRALPAADALVRNDKWAAWKQSAPIAPLSSARLGLVGIGRIGGEVARMLAPMVSEVIAYDPVAGEVPGIRLVELDEVVQTSDIISIHCPLLPATENLFDAARLATMKPGSVLVNVSRGPIVKTSDLPAALDAGRPAYAALDVLPVEPPTKDDPLLTHPRMLLSPHIAWYSTASIVRLRVSLAQRCASILIGGQAPTVVNAAGLAAAPA